MKSFSFLTAMLLSIAALSSLPGETKAQRVSVNFSVFQNELGRYGRWVNMPRYGQVWIYNEPGFRPYYSNGYWDYSDYGWTWVSNYDWGWAPFHYGRWEYDSYYGWIWIPGYDWAPAWVSWSESGDYYGWAPLGYGIDINISIGAVPYDRWVFCSRPYMNNRRFRDYCAPFSNNRVIVRNTTIINNYYSGRDGRYWKGPGRRDVERYSGSNVRVRQIDNDHRFGNKRWDDDRREYAGRERDGRRDDNRFDRRDNRFEGREGNRVDERNIDRSSRNGRDIGQDRRWDNRNGNNEVNRNHSDNNIGRGRPSGEDVRRGRPERQRQIRDENSRQNRPEMRREMPNREQRQYNGQDRQPQRREPSVTENRRPENRSFERGGRERGNGNGGEQPQGNGRGRRGNQ